MLTRRLCFILASLVVAVSGSVQQGRSPAPLSDPLNLVALYNGHWHSEDESFNTRFSKASKETVEIDNTCTTAGDFYVCHQRVSKPSGPVSAMMIFLWNATEHLFDTYGVDSAGGDAYHGHLTIKGSDYVWASAKPDPSRPNQWRTLNTFSGRDHITYKVQVSSDRGEHWTTTKQGHETRVSK